MPVVSTWKLKECMSVETTHLLWMFSSRLCVGPWFSSCWALHVHLVAVTSISFQDPHSISQGLSTWRGCPPALLCSVGPLPCGPASPSLTLEGEPLSSSVLSETILSFSVSVSWDSSRVPASNMSLGSGLDTKMPAADSCPLPWIPHETGHPGSSTLCYVYRDVTVGAVEDCAARVSIAGPRLLSQKGCLQGWLMDGIWELDYWEGSDHSLVGVAHSA